MSSEKFVQIIQELYESLNSSVTEGEKRVNQMESELAKYQPDRLAKIQSELTVVAAQLGRLKNQIYERTNKKAG